jgi:hypothetical protein
MKTIFMIIYRPVLLLKQGKRKVEFALEQAMKAQSWSGVIALLFL